MGRSLHAQHRVLSRATWPHRWHPRRVRPPWSCPTTIRPSTPRSPRATGWVVSRRLQPRRRRRRPSRASRPGAPQTLPTGHPQNRTGSGRQRYPPEARPQARQWREDREPPGLQSQVQRHGRRRSCRPVRYSRLIPRPPHERTRSRAAPRRRVSRRRNPEDREPDWSLRAMRQRRPRQGDHSLHGSLPQLRWDGCRGVGASDPPSQNAPSIASRTSPTSRRRCSGSFSRHRRRKTESDGETADGRPLQSGSR